LLAAARAGSSDAVGQALEACRSYLLAVAQRELDDDLRSKGGASDLVQDTFLEAHRHFDRFHGELEVELRAWLRRLLLNNLADFRRLYRETEKRDAGREIPLGFASAGRATTEPLADSGPSPSTVVAGQEQSRQLETILRSLPDDYREVLELRHRDGRSFSEIAQAMQRTENAVRKLWARAVIRMQNEWERAQ
jgi:RNA polymerase sigma-70 factor (ECF subfamily)